MCLSDNNGFLERLINKKTELKNMLILQSNPELYAFYENKENWNTLGNLQLLNDSENKSKNKSKLSEWVVKPAMPYKLSDYFVPKDDSKNYIINDNEFKSFIEARRKLLVNAILTNLKI